MYGTTQKWQNLSHPSWIVKKDDIFEFEFLIKFNELSHTPLEKAESIDMLRVLEHGYKVKMVFTKHETYSVDTVDDLRRVEYLIKNDPLVDKYRQEKW